MAFEAVAVEEDGRRRRSVQVEVAVVRPAEAAEGGIADKRHLPGIQDHDDIALEVVGA